MHVWHKFIVIYEKNVFLLHYHDSLAMTLECRTAQNSSEDERTIVFDLTKKNMQEL